MSRILIIASLIALSGCTPSQNEIRLVCTGGYTSEWITFDENWAGDGWYLRGGSNWSFYSHNTNGQIVYRPESGETCHVEKRRYED